MKRAIVLAFQLAAAASAVAQGNGRDLVPKPYVYLGAGRFEPDSNGAFTNRDEQGSFAIGVGKGFAPRMSWEVNFLNFGQEVDTPVVFRSQSLFVRTDSRADIDTYGLAGQVRFSTTLWRFEPYAAVGAGWYRSQITIQRRMTLPPFNFASSDIKKSDSGIGTSVLLGTDLRIGERWHLGFQYRALSLTADFGGEIAGKNDVGGKFRLITSRWTF